MAYAPLSRCSCNIIISIVLFIVMLGYSCNLKDNTEINYPAESNSILGKADELLDGGQIRQSDAYLDLV